MNLNGLDCERALDLRHSIRLIRNSDKQHIALYIGMGGLTPCMNIVEAILTPVAGEERKVLDIGVYISRKRFYAICHVYVLTRSR
jgi:hypothetical protein